MPVPSGRLLVVFAIVALPAAIWVLWPLGILILLAALDAWFSRNRLRATHTECPDLVRMWKGRTASIPFRVTNGAPVALRLRIGLVAPEELALEAEELTVQLPASPAAAQLTWTATPNQRGQYRINACKFETPSALGLWAIRAGKPVTLEIRVYPDLASSSVSAGFLRRGHTGSHPQRQIGRGREFEKLRDYAPGDGFDEVDWKATARRGRPITRVFQVEKTQEVYVILDASRLTARPAEAGSPDSILERNITAALLLALQAEKQGDLFGLVTFSDQVHSFVRARAGKAHYGACRESLYRLQPRIVTPDFDELGTLLRLRLQRRALLIFLTELDDPALAESFVRTAALLQRRHLVLIGMMQPAGAKPLFEEPAPETLDAIYDSLAGHLQWNQLRTTAKILERQGVHFFLFEPEMLASQLASAYVNLKRRQIL